MKVRYLSAARIAGGALLLSAATAQAQTLDDFAACAGIAADGKRLECYDKLGTRLAMTADERRAAAVAKAEEDFGLPPERRKDRAERLAIDHTVNATITAVGGNYERPTVTLDNGQVWRITSSGRLQQFLKPGMAVTIGEGSVSGYRLRTEAVNGIETVRRIQ